MSAGATSCAWGGLTVVQLVSKPPNASAPAIPASATARRLILGCKTTPDYS
jgi:hypothetical protein